MILPQHHNRSSRGTLSARAWHRGRWLALTPPRGKESFKPAQARSEIDTALNSRSNVKNAKCKAID